MQKVGTPDFVSKFIALERRVRNLETFSRFRTAAAASSGTVGNWYYEYTTLSAGGSAYVYTLAYTPVAFAATVYLNGLALNEGTEFTISGTTLNLTTTFVSGDILAIRYGY